VQRTRKRIPGRSLKDKPNGIMPSLLDQQSCELIRERGVLQSG
jgi:hypothetical protein